MAAVDTYSSDVAFTPAVKAIKTRKGSREGYAHVEERGGWRTEIDENLAGFLARDKQLLSRDGCRGRKALYPASQRAEGLHQDSPTRTPSRLPTASGGRQYIAPGQSVGRDPKAHIFVMDYAHRRRVKIWGEARVVEDDPALTQSLMPKELQGAPRADHRVQDFGLAHQLPAAYPAEVRRRRRRTGIGRARHTDPPNSKQEMPAPQGQPAAVTP